MLQVLAGLQILCFVGSVEELRGFVVAMQTPLLGQPGDELALREGPMHTRVSGHTLTHTDSLASCVKDSVRERKLAVPLR